MDTHKHCIFCGISIPAKDMFCSAKCQETFTGQKQKVVKSQRIMVVALALIFALAVYLNLR